MRNGIEHAAVKRDKRTKAARLELRGVSPWRLYAGPSPETIDYSAPVLEGAKDGVFLIPGPPERRFYFTLRAEQGDKPLAERLLPMAGGYNFRDLGGFMNWRGQSTAWGRLFRTDDLTNLTPDDLDYLSGIPITSVVDFRTQREREAGPDKLPASVSQYYRYEVVPGSLSRENFAAKGATSAMVELYRDLVTEPAIVSVYRDFFTLIQNDASLPLLFHCSAGKDRTGLAAALILLALGVDRRTVMEDYLASGIHLAGKYPDESSDLFRVRPEFLESALEAIEGNYGCVEKYLTGPLGVSLERLHELYLVA